ncbi:hypothetical protein [Spiroplasma endosymbiont of Amphimallon solstitiale]|uniref:hypothetical protein n=1 Tax=Spiroplasma endosymbiont of Amphimallon solstitiale TaxID=3066288 RepID=UPI00313CEC94
MNKEKLNNYLINEINKYYKLPIEEALKNYNLSAQHTLKIIYEKIKNGEFDND